MSHRLLRALATAADGAFITDEDQRVIFWNQAAARLLDFTSDQVIRRPCHEILRGRDEQGRLVCRRHCRVATTARTGGPVANYDTLVRTGSEGTRWVNMSTLAFLPNGRPADTMVVHLFRDISQKKKNEQLFRRVLSAAKELKCPELPPGVPTVPEEKSTAELTNREREVLSLLAQGLKTADIAQTLSISPSTVRNHIRNVLKKLNVHSRLEAVIYAFKNGFVT
jgi:PAS domain S-box-containing protein